MQIFYLHVAMVFYCGGLLQLLNYAVFSLGPVVNPPEDILAGKGTYLPTILRSAPPAPLRMLPLPLPYMQSALLAPIIGLAFGFFR